jgi:hypothetical protein
MVSDFVTKDIRVANQILDGLKKESDYGEYELRIAKTVMKQ